MLQRTVDRPSARKQLSCGNAAATSNGKAGAAPARRKDGKPSREEDKPVGRGGILKGAEYPPISLVPPPVEIGLCPISLAIACNREAYPAPPFGGDGR